MGALHLCGEPTYAHLQNILYQVLICTYMFRSLLGTSQNAFQEYSKNITNYGICPVAHIFTHLTECMNCRQLTNNISTYSFINFILQHNPTF